MLNFITIIISAFATIITFFLSIALLISSFFHGIKSSIEIIIELFTSLFNYIKLVIKKPFAKPSKFYINR